MATSAAQARGGFWRGFGLGLIVAGLGVLAIMIAFPPVPLAEPDIDPSISEGPDAPASPGIAAAPPDAASTPLGPSAPGPLIETGDAPAPAPEDGAGSPSLVPVPD